MTKVVILGSNSFSGQDFIDYLLGNSDLEVIGISRAEEKQPVFLRYKGQNDLSRFRFFRMDMNRDMEALLSLLDAERPEYIVNFAAQSEVAPSWARPEDWFQTNTVALSHLVNHLRSSDYLERYLHISSPEAYGNCVGTVTEETPDNPSTPYAVSKAAADMLLEVFRREFDFPLITVRSTNVYGPRQQLFKIIPRVHIYLKLGKTIQLQGGGYAVKSWINIRDVSIGQLMLLRKGLIGERYHLSPDSGIPVREVVEKICAAAGRSMEEACTEVGDRTGQDAVYVIDSTKARKQLGWLPKISLDEGLAQVSDWVDENWSEIENQPLEYIHRP